MKKIEFSVHIAASPEKVWKMMLEPASYREWVNPAWPGSYYEGNWTEGEDIRFIGPNDGGTLATIAVLKPYDLVVAKHIAIINKDGSEDRTSEMAKNWIGTTETYRFKKNRGKTELTTEMFLSPEWEKMFTDGWPVAMEKLKEICER